jgi:hypothetical protein
MTSRPGSTVPKPSLSEARQYCDIVRWTSAYPGQCEGCSATPRFVLKDDQGHALLQCADCLTETFRKDPEMTGRVLRNVAERL